MLGLFVLPGFLLALASRVVTKTHSQRHQTTDFLLFATNGVLVLLIPAWILPAALTPQAVSSTILAQDNFVVGLLDRRVLLGYYIFTVYAVVLGLVMGWLSTWVLRSPIWQRIYRLDAQPDSKPFRPTQRPRHSSTRRRRRK
jgi:hypothetical protein